MKGNLISRLWKNYKAKKERKNNISNIGISIEAKIFFFFINLFLLTSIFCFVCARQIFMFLPCSLSLQTSWKYIFRRNLFTKIKIYTFIIVWIPSRFYFSSFHFITVQSKIQYCDKLCFDFPSIMAVEKNIQSKTTKFII